MSEAAAVQAGAAAWGCGAHPHEHQPGAHHLQDRPDPRLVWLPGALLRLERPRRAEAPGLRRSQQQLISVHSVRYSGQLPLEPAAALGSVRHSCWSHRQRQRCSCSGLSSTAAWAADAANIMRAWDLRRQCMCFSCSQPGACKEWMAVSQLTWTALEQPCCRKQSPASDDELETHCKTEEEPSAQQCPVWKRGASDCSEGRQASQKWQQWLKSEISQCTVMERGSMHAAVSRQLEAGRTHHSNL